MKLFLLASTSLAAVLVSAGCYSTQPTTLHGSEDLPKEDWYTLNESNNMVEAIGPQMGAALADQRAQVAKELSETGEISADTRKQIDEMNERCNSAYLTSFDLIASNPTPGLNGMAETWDARRYNDVNIYNQNLRGLADEWSRFWLMDYPTGSPYNLYSPAGRF